MTRPVKTLISFLTAAALVLGAWMLEGAPVHTAAAICRRAERELLTADIQPIKTFRQEGDTLVLARVGEQALSFWYNAPQGVEAPQFGDEGVIVYRNNCFYALGAGGFLSYPDCHSLSDVTGPCQQASHYSRSQNLFLRGRLCRKGRLDLCGPCK